MKEDIQTSDLRLYIIYSITNTEDFLCPDRSILGSTFIVQ